MANLLMIANLETFVSLNLIGKMCNSIDCSEYKKEYCSKLSKPPYVCNGCDNKRNCTLSKCMYEPIKANKEYLENLKESRTGITLNQLEIDKLNDILVPLIVKQGQSIHHAVISNKNSIMISERQIYNLIDEGILNIKNIDLPRKVRFRVRRKRKTYYKIDKKCLVNRTYDDYLNFIKENPDLPIVEMDTVEGIKGGKVLLTLHLVSANFMFAFIRDSNDAKSVIDIFDYIEQLLGIETFKSLFGVILTDNGSEFSNPLEIEFSKVTGQRRTYVFYCEPNRSDQKGSCEVNHEFIRRVVPKGKPFDKYSQDDINKLMSHINSYKRQKLNNCSPIQLFSLIYDINIANKLGIFEVSSNDIILNKNIFK